MRKPKIVPLQKKRFHAKSSNSNLKPKLYKEILAYNIGMFVNQYRND